MIRPPKGDDLEQIIEIHRKFYQEEFDLDDFFQRLEGAVVIDNNDGQIITVGGIRPIYEIVNMTNKDVEIKVRREAMYKILQTALFTGARLKYGQLHAFIQDEKWEHHLSKVGFRPTKGKGMYINL